METLIRESNLKRPTSGVVFLVWIQKGIFSVIARRCEVTKQTVQAISGNGRIVFEIATLPATPVARSFGLIRNDKKEFALTNLVERRLVSALTILPPQNKI